VVDEIGGVHSFSVLWHSPQFMNKSVSGIGDALKGMPLPTDKVVIAHEGHASSSYQKSLEIVETTVDKSLKTFDSEGLSYISFSPLLLSFFVNLTHCFLLQLSNRLSETSLRRNSLDSMPF
jgi:hypothetical protein